MFSPPWHAALDSPGVALAPVVVGVWTTRVAGTNAGGMSEVGDLVSHQEQHPVVVICILLRHG